MLKLLMPEIQKIKSILETKYGNGKRLSTASLVLKPNNAFLELFGNATTAIAFDEWYDTRNTKPIYSIRQMPLKIPK
jgi:hypothetical protein